MSAPQALEEVITTSIETIETSPTETNLTISSDNKEASSTETNMQVADNSDSNITNVKSTTESPATPENVPFTQIEEGEIEEEEEEDNMSDIPGIRVSMATIIELPPVEEQQRLSNESTPTISEKVIDEMFSSIITLPEEQQIRFSEVSNQQYIELNEASNVPPVVDVTNVTSEDSEYSEYSEYNEFSEITEILTSETSIMTENTEGHIDTNENAQNIQDDVQSIPVHDAQSVQVDHNGQSFSIIQNILNDQNIQDAQIVHNVQNAQQSTIIDQGISQEQIANYKTIQAVPPSIEILPQPLDQNTSVARGNVQSMDTLNTASADYVSPPSTLTTPTDYEDELLNNDEEVVQQGVKRSHEDSGYQDDYQRDPKRAAYDNGSSRPEYDSGNGSGSGGENI